MVHVAVDEAAGGAAENGAEQASKVRQSGYFPS